jgi:hypothetical protein
MKCSDGTFRSIYCHWDGYPENNGKLLLEHYKDEAKVSALMDLGNISSLNPEIGEKHDFDYNRSFDYSGADCKPKDPKGKLSKEEIERLDRMCHAYGRDRGEKGQEAKVHEDEAAFLERADEEYTYLFKDGKWLWRGGRGKLRPLTEKSFEKNEDAN